MTSFPLRKRRAGEAVVDVGHQRLGEASGARALPSVKGRVAALSLDALRVTGVEHLGSVEEVRAALGSAGGG